ncbi:MAG: ATP-binding protein [Burkholderiaceae bacterium]
MARPLRHILLIEDSADDRIDLRQMLLRGSTRRYRFSETQLGAEGVRMALDPKTGPLDCVLLDYDLPDTDAHGVLAALCRETGMPPCPVVVITGTETEEGMQLLDAGAQDYIGKRWASADSLTRAVENAIQRFAMMVERRRADVTLRISEERYRALFNSIDSAYAVIEMMFDDNGAAVDARYVQVNGAFTQQTGLNEVEGQSVRSLIPGMVPMWSETYCSVALTGVPVRMEQHSAALQLWYDVHAFRLGDPQAHQVAVLFNDITERKQFERALVAAKAEAEKATRAKSDFLLSMSHELRSPLSTMLGFTQLIEAGTPAPTAAQQASVQQILHAGWYLLGLINEILDLTSIESGKLVLTRQAVSLGEVMEECRAMVEPQALAAGIELRFTSVVQACFACADPSCLVQGDPSRIKQVLLNLLTNAIIYNRRSGHVEVRWAATTGQCVRVNVEDTGFGLSAAQVAQLFEPFNRLGQESGGEPGTGIGLVISKRLVELMGGRIGVDSTVGVGSCFWFELDAARAVLAQGLPARTVLCIENDATRLQRVEELIARWPGVTLLRARNIPSGVQIARTARPDAILIGMGLQDPGAAAEMRVLRQNPATAHIPVIALATDGVPHDIESCRAAGYFDYLPQPWHGETFGRALEQAFQRTHASDCRATTQ